MKNNFKKFTAILLAIILVSAVALTGCSSKESVLIYTSVEDYVIEDMNARLSEQFPNYNITIEYVSTGSHAAKLLTEGVDSECDITYDLEYAYTGGLDGRGKSLVNISITEDNMVVAVATFEHN